MNRFIANVVALALFFSVGTARGDETAAVEIPVETQIKNLIPAATGMNRADFKKLATSPNPNPGLVSTVSLSMELMKATTGPKTTEEMLGEFGFDKGVVPKPSMIGKEYARPVKGSPDLVTAVHLNRITKFTCVVNEGSAKGMVAYKVPSLYSGRFKYEAKREQEKWRVVRITMPARKIELIRDEDGNWKKAANN